MATISRDRAEPPYVLAVDIGTSSIRAILFDRLGRSINGVHSRTTYTLTTTSDGGVEADADEMLEQFAFVLDEILEKAEDLAQKIEAVGMDTLVANVLGIDASGTPVTPVYTWADTRNADDVQFLRTHIDQEATHDRTGVVQHSSYLPARFLWLERTQPETFDRIRHWLSIGEYILLKLFGEKRVSYSVASWTGLLNRRTLEWDSDLLALLPVQKNQLSPLCDIHDAFCGLHAEYSERWKPLKDKPFFPACGDGVSSNIGTGGTDSSKVVVNLGTSGAMRVVIDDLDQGIPYGLWCYRVDAARGLLGGALSNGGNLFAWLTETLDVPGEEEIEKALETLPPDGHGLTVLPFLVGERSTGWNPHARAAIVGINLNTSAIEIVQAGMECVAYRFALIYDLLCPKLPREHTIIASGGALLGSHIWSQMLADVLGKEIILSRENEATSRGAALLALQSLGALKKLSDAPAETGKIFVPNMDAHKVYIEAIARHKDLYSKLINYE